MVSTVNLHHYTSALAGDNRAAISVDTFYGSVAVAAAQAGRDWRLLYHPLSRLRRVLTQEHTRGFNIHASNSKGGIIRPALQAGADVINDVSGGTIDPEMLSAVVRRCRLTSD